MAKVNAAPKSKQPVKPKREQSMVTVVTAPKPATSAYSMQRKIEELEDRVETCEAVVEHNFGETLGQLITERTRAIERQHRHTDNKTMEAICYVGIGLLLLTAVLINSFRSSRYEYCTD
jgi:hypothetical protein